MPTVSQRVFPTLLVVCLLSLLSVADTPDSGKMNELTGKLEGIQKDMKVIRGEIDQTNKDYYKFQHDIVYTNGPARELYQEIKAIEKSLNEKRKELSTLTYRLPEMRERLKQRDAVYKRLRHLKERERLVRNEISALRMASATVKVEK